MKFIKIYFFALLIGNISFSQEKISFFHYALNSHIESPDTLEAIWGMELEFTTKRTYLDDSIFIESRLFTGDDDKAIKFKIKDGVWFYKKHFMWHLFYDYKKNVGGKISFLREKYLVKLENVVTLRNEILYKLTFTPVNNVSYSHFLEYYFSPNKGIVLIISNGGSILLRTDYFNIPLSHKEIQMIQNSK
ncbi:MAG: hypothetical protein RJA76_970 [Bacteroidota bacterium]|jgi:hypothetical protein